MARREPRVTALVNEMIDRFADRGECDFHTEFAVPFRAPSSCNCSGFRWKTSTSFWHGRTA